MTLTAKLAPLLVMAVTAAACAQTTAPAPATQESGGGAVATEASADVRDILKMLQERKATLKDFTAKIDNSVTHLDGGIEGNRGTVDYVDDAAGPKFSVHFTLDTADGKAVRKHERDIIFDGKALTYVDFGAKDFKQQKSPPDKPFDVNSLESPMPMPVGLKVDEVLQNFVVTMAPGMNAEKATLELVPRTKGKFEYTKLTLTVDKKLQLPTKIIAAGKNGDVTTIEFKDAEINSGKAKIRDATPPKEPGWTIEIK